jgi:lambda repressor-like predicted transcriptional regulator
MKMTKDEMHLDVYGNRSELHTGDSKTVFWEGRQSEEAVQRVRKITQTFQDGFYPNAMNHLQNVIAGGGLSDEQSGIIKALADGVTSEVGRALVGLSCLQLAIKSIEPKQSIRLHKGGRSDSRFSWQEGISMRTLDNTFNTPFLREYGLLKLNKDGIMMTRSLAENYPYSSLYKAEMRGPIKQWVNIVEFVEAGELPPYPALCLLLSLLKNHSDSFAAKAARTISLAKESKSNFVAITELLVRFFTTTTYSARAFEVVIHGFMQACSEMKLAAGTLVPLSQMRSANKKHGNVGDIELKQGNQIIESWDAKYSKPYLRDELEELDDKLEYHPNVETAGFIVNTAVERSEEIVNRADEIALLHDCEVLLLSFSEWVELKTKGITDVKRKELGTRWLIAVVESLGQKRPQIAPIDEPCDEWLDSLNSLLS